MKNRLIKETRGGDFIEYIIICGVCALVALVAFTQIGTNITAKAQAIGSAISGLNFGQSGASGAAAP
jgi:Flp pilus assembly pilin Flp